MQSKNGKRYLTQAEAAQAAEREAKAKAQRAATDRILGLTSAAPRPNPPAERPEPAADQLDPAQIPAGDPAPQAAQPPDKAPGQGLDPESGPSTPPDSSDEQKGTETDPPDYTPRLDLFGPQLNSLDPGTVLPLPAQPANDLTPRELRLVAHMVAGRSWQEALTAEGATPKAREREESPRQAIVAECERSLRLFASNCAASAEWIVREVLILYRRAAQAEPVLDRKGNPTGVYRFDGATARGCLEMLGNQQGMFKAKGGTMAVSDVAQLLQAIAQRGKPALPAERGRLVGSTSTVPTKGNP